ncbi:hypothetical protein BJ085DRAFT_28153 [Dimargaris cristalligena]|uniref:CUE domain-containing protein n=1 Tax=Dimargaris cristalligena TaxID=215637 RepID=A0A4P9ZPX9_9FUNG|nr:hypothetical protein BJ085DRAFT_28153 [Dimargaris cristalligena]|eukprot:RKP35377.1 hypothetical protein BJ085DRAFT_28153 [Dimargaris cristalligena]
MASPVNPNVSILKRMFPDIEPDICEAVLQANQGNLNTSISTLLEMSNPQSPAAKAAPGSTTTPAQADAGEEGPRTPVVDAFADTPSPARQGAAASPPWTASSTEPRDQVPAEEPGLANNRQSSPPPPSTTAGLATPETALANSLWAVEGSPHQPVDPAGVGISSSGQIPTESLLAHAPAVSGEGREVAAVTMGSSPVSVPSATTATTTTTTTAAVDTVATGSEGSHHSRDNMEFNRAEAAPMSEQASSSPAVDTSRDEQIARDLELALRLEDEEREAFEQQQQHQQRSQRQSYQFANQSGEGAPPPLPSRQSLQNPRPVYNEQGNYAFLQDNHQPNNRRYRYSDEDEPDFMNKVSAFTETTKVKLQGFFHQVSRKFNEAVHTEGGGSGENYNEGSSSSTPRPADYTGYTNANPSTNVNDPQRRANQRRSRFINDDEDEDDNDDDLYGAPPPPLPRRHTEPPQTPGSADGFRTAEYPFHDDFDQRPPPALPPRSRDESPLVSAAPARSPVMATVQPGRIITAGMGGSGSGSGSGRSDGGRTPVTPSHLSSPRSPTTTAAAAAGVVSASDRPASGFAVISTPRSATDLWFDEEQQAAVTTPSARLLHSRQQQLLNPHNTTVGVGGVNGAIDSDFSDVDMSGHSPQTTNYFSPSPTISELPADNIKNKTSGGGEAGERASAGTAALTSGEPHRPMSAMSEPRSSAKAAAGASWSPEVGNNHTATGSPSIPAVRAASHPPPHHGNDTADTEWNLIDMDIHPSFQTKQP